MVKLKKFHHPKKGFLLGVNKDGYKVYLSDFSWDCGWYWGGGYVGEYNKSKLVAHLHFDSLFLKGDFIDNIKQYFKSSTLTQSEWWRLGDLVKQFYAHKESAECFKHGGHYTNRGRTESELNEHLSITINKHIKDVIIPEVIKLLSPLVVEDEVSALMEY